MILMQVGLMSIRTLKDRFSRELLNLKEGK